MTTSGQDSLSPLLSTWKVTVRKRPEFRSEVWNRINAKTEQPNKFLTPFRIRVWFGIFLLCLIVETIVLWATLALLN